MQMSIGFDYCLGFDYSKLKKIVRQPYEFKLSDVIKKV